MSETKLELEAEKIYPIIPYGHPTVNWDRANKQEGFIAGATSIYVEAEKLRFAIEQLKEFKQHYEERIGTGKIWNRIQELEQQLKTIENE